MNALDSALEAARRADLPNVGAAPPPENPDSTLRIESERIRKEQEILEAEQRRAEIRAETARLKRQNQLNKETAEKEKAEKEARKRQESERKASSWEERFKRYRPAKSVHFTNALIGAIVRDGGLLDGIRARAAALGPHVEAWVTAFESRGKFSRDEFKRQILEDMEENARNLKEGLTEMRELPDREAFERQAAANRAICKAAQKEAWDAIRPVVIEIADDLQSTARRLAAERETAERKTADEFGVTFEPSCVMLGLVCAGYELRQFIQDNWLLGHIADPRDLIFGILDPKKDWR